jgi:hypothetical protein
MTIRSLSLLVLLAVMASLAPRAAAAQHVTVRGPGVVSIEAEGASLGAVLRELTSLAPFSRLRIDPSADARLVTVSVTDTPLHVAIVAVLRAADVDFAFAGSDSGQPFRLVAAIFEADAPALPASGATVTAPVPVAPARPEPNEADAPADDAAAQADAAKTRQSVAALGQALAVQPLAPQSLGFVTLPFPDRAGAPVVETVAPGASRTALPFPAAAASPVPAGSTSTSTETRPMPATTAFPALQQFSEAVGPGR